MLRRIDHVRWDDKRLYVLTIFERAQDLVDIRTSWGVLCSGDGSSIPRMIRFSGLLEVINTVPSKTLWTPNLSSRGSRVKIERWEISAEMVGLSHRTVVRQRLQKGVNDCAVSNSVL